jgi:phage shock protein A
MDSAHTPHFVRQNGVDDYEQQINDRVSQLESRIDSLAERIQNRIRRTSEAEARWNATQSEGFGFTP